MPLVSLAQPQRRRKREKLWAKKKMNVQHTFWRVSLPLLHAAVVKHDWNGSDRRDFDFVGNAHTEAQLT